MAYDIQKNIELYLLKAANFSEESAPNQKKYYLEVAEWMRENNFATAEEAVAAMRETEYYEGGSIAKTADDIALRISAMEKVGYEDVAAVHRMRQQKFNERGNAYAFSQEWLDDYKTAGAEHVKYAERKEAFGKIFSGYFQIAGNPQSEHRKEAAQDIAAGLQRLQELGVSFDQLASERVYRDLTMTTEQGMKNFVEFIHSFNGRAYDDDISDIAAEQAELAQWVESHKADLVAAGQCEQWNDGCAIAVPSDAEGGYDYIAIKEVK
jgi:hypothetical protein